MVNAVKESHPGKFEVENRPARQHADELKAHGIDSHGVVCIQGDKTLWTHKDHIMTKAEFKAGLDKALKAIE